jgi:hypothetical protein
MDCIEEKRGPPAGTCSSRPALGTQCLGPMGLET